MFEDVCGEAVWFDGEVSGQPESGVSADEAAVSLRRCVRDDFRASSSGQRLLLAATAGWLVYEWGFGNETVTPWVLARVLARSSGGRSVVATGVVGLMFTAGQQMASGFTTAAGFSMFSRTARSAWNLLRARLDETPREWAQQSWVARALVVFTLGTTAVVLIQMSLTGETGVRRHRRTVIQAALMCGVLVGAVGASAAGLVWLGRSVPVWRAATDSIVRVLGNPLFWIGLLTLLVAVNALRRRVVRNP